MKKTDGKFLSLCYDVAKDYPQIKTDDWYVDIMAANLVNDQINSNFNVFILPNLYGDIITDEAAQLQGGVGTAGSAISVADTLCLKRSMDPHLVWWRMVLRNTPTRPASTVRLL